MQTNNFSSDNPFEVDLILSASWILPIRPSEKILNSHAIVIDKGAIVDLLPIAQASLQYRAREQQHFEHHLLMPGLINTHTHAAMSLFRGYADDLALMDWLQQHIWPAEARYVDPQFVYQGTELAMAEMLRSGTTCFSDMYLFPNQSAHAVNNAGMRAQIAFPVFNVPSAWGKDADEYIHKGLGLNDQYRQHPLISVAFGPHAPYTNDEHTLERIATLSTELELNIQIHLHETAAEIKQSIDNSGDRPIQRLQQLGMLSPQLQAVHCTQLDKNDIALLSTHQVQVIHCPQSNLKLASGTCAVGSLLEQQINVALGTDGAASNNDLDMFDELRCAALIAKGHSADACQIPATTALEMATINAAKALSLDTQIGSIEKNKRADIIALDLNRIEAQPIHNISSLLSYSNCASWVQHVWVDGQQLLKDRQLLSLNEAEIIHNARAWQAKLS